jgi:hypothetical protein
MATLIEHGDVIDLRDLAEMLTEKLDEWSDLSGEEQAEVRNTVDAVRSALADLGVGLDDDDDDTVQIDRRVVDELSTWANEEPTAIAEDYFTTYTQELVEEVYPSVLHMEEQSEWPYRHLTVNWQAAADELKQDYSEFDLDGHAYLIRSV